ncbi:MAG: hypothetical protein V4671_33660 [Armatimonadota bacterium]
MSPNDQQTENASSLTDEQRTHMEEWLQAHPYGDQDENGIDVGAIRRNLTLTPGQRILRLQQAIDSLREIKDVTARE